MITKTTKKNGWKNKKKIVFLCCTYISRLGNRKSISKIPFEAEELHLGDIDEHKGNLIINICDK